MVSETAATCSVLRLLEQGRLLTPPGLPGLLPHCGSSTLGSALRTPSMAAAAAAGGGGGVVAAAGGSPPSTAGSGAVAAAHGLFSFRVPSLLTRVSSAPLAMSGNLQELSARYLSSSAFEPYSRTGGKDAADRKALD